MIILKCMGQEVARLEFDCEDCSNIQKTILAVEVMTIWALKNGYSPRDMSYLIV